MSIEIVTTSGKKIGRISDDAGGIDTILLDDKELPLEQAYTSDDTRKSFNDKLKEFRNDTRKD